MQAVSARDLIYLYRSPHGDVAALRGLSLEIGEGETVSALGPSGSGKSTLLSLAAGFMRPSSGELVVLGKHLERASGREAAQLRRRQIGIIRQHYHRALPQELTVAEIVALPSRLLGEQRGNDADYVPALLERAGLAARAGARPAELSGGEQQRVALCAALAKRPRLLLADEPTGELDAYTRDEVVELMIELSAELGTAALIVTHDPQVAERTQRTIHVRDGRLAAEGTDRPVLVVDEQGWLRLPRGLRRQARIGDRVRAEASPGKIELHAETIDEASDALSAIADAAIPSTDSGDDHADERTADMAVVLENVVKQYGDPDPKPVIDLSWAAAAQRFHVIAGPSGSGKTTLLNLIAALDRPDSGSITVGAQRVDSLNPDEAAGFREKQIGYLSQHSTLIAYMSARENVELALAFRGHAPDGLRAEAQQWLDWVGLGDKADRPAEHLSGGEQRRVALARALAPMPALLLADEPTAHLDQLTGRTVIQLLQNAVDEHGTTVIAASHDPDVIAAAGELLNLDSPARRPPARGGQPKYTGRLWTAPGPPTSARSFSGRRSAGVISACLGLTIAAVVLGITQPWSGSNGASNAAILQKLEAAIASPGAGEVLYQQYTFPAAGARAHGVRIAVSSWTSGGAPPRHYRETIAVSAPPGPNTGPKAVQAGAMLGPIVASPFTAYFGSQRVSPIVVSPPVASDAIDPVGLVRVALADPNARHAPIVAMQGRFVHVQLFVRDSQGDPGTITYVANAHTYKPSQVLVHNVDGVSTFVGIGGKLGFAAFALFAFAPEFGPTGGATNGTFTYTYRTYAYKHATAEERKLANLQPVRPGAQPSSALPEQTGQQCVRPFGIIENGRCVKTKPGSAGT